MSLRLKYTLIAGIIGPLVMMLTLPIIMGRGRPIGDWAVVLFSASLLILFLRMPAFLKRIHAGIAAGRLSSLKGRIKLIIVFWMEIAILLGIFIGGGVGLAIIVQEGLIQSGDWQRIGTSLFIFPFGAFVGGYLGIISLPVGIPMGLLFLKWLLADIRKQEAKA